MGKVIGWLVVIVVVLSMPEIIFGVLRDMLVITWAASPWYGQVFIIAVGVMMVLLVFRIVWWVLTGRSTFRHR